MRNHSKSRRGCLQCKQRKVKCDETLPQCKRCHRRDEKCSYLAEYGSPVPHPPSQHDYTTQLLRAQDGSGSSNQAVVSLESHLVDMDLLHMYLTETHKTLWARAEAHRIWRDDIFREGMRHPPLLDGVLAISALHKVSLDVKVRARYQSTILDKQKKALAGLVEMLRSVDADNSIAVFLLSIIVCFWSLASKGLPKELSVLSAALDSGLNIHCESSRDQNTALFQFLEMTQRVQPLKAVVSQTRPSIVASTVPHFWQGDGEQNLPSLPLTIASAVERLELRLQQSNGAAQRLLQLNPRLNIRRIFQISRSQDLRELVIEWPINLPEAYINELQSKDPAALTLLSYWAVCMFSLEDRWWAKGWSHSLITEISGLVTGEWALLVGWPVAYLAIRTE